MVVDEIRFENAWFGVVNAFVSKVNAVASMAVDIANLIILAVWRVQIEDIVLRICCCYPVAMQCTMWIVVGVWKRVALEDLVEITDVVRFEVSHPHFHLVLTFDSGINFPILRTKS